MSGRERREQRRRAREGFQWTPFSVGLASTAAVGVAAAVLLVLFVLDVGGGGEAVDRSGPPEISGEPTYTESGLGIIEIEEGSGETPQAGQTVSVHYTGWLSDGTKFDSSLDRGRPFTFVLGAGQVIRGWDEGLATMKVGGRRRLIIPSELGYGPAGSPPTIPPDAQLTFDVELLEIVATQ